MARFIPACCNALYRQRGRSTCPLLSSLCSSRRTDTYRKVLLFFCSVHRIAWRDDTILFRRVTIQLPQVAIYILVSIFMSLWSLQIERGVEARNSGSRRPFLYIRKMQSMTNSNHTARHIRLISPNF